MTIQTHFILCLQLRRAGAIAITKAIADKPGFQSLDLDSNEISEAAVDDIEVLFVPRLATVLVQHNLETSHVDH